MTINLNIGADILEYQLQKIKVLHEVLCIQEMSVKAHDFDAEYEILASQGRFSIKTHYCDMLEFEEATIIKDGVELEKIDFHPYDSMGSLDSLKLYNSLKDVVCTSSEK